MASLVSLPSDLICEISYCLRVQDLIRLTCVSKYLRDLITTSIHHNNFAYSYLDRSTRNKKKKNLTHSFVIYNRDFDETRSEDPEDVVQRFINKKFTNPLYLGDHFWFLGSHNGIICFGKLRSDDEKKRMLYMWNPALHQIRTIQQNPDSLDIRCTAFLGFGFDASTQNYKIVGVYNNLADVYSLKNNSWNVIRYADRPPTLRFCFEHSVVEFNGCLHWISTEACIHFYNNTKEAGNASILSFNLSTDKLGENLIPDCIISKNGLYCGLGVFKENLSLLTYYHNNDKYEVWSLVEPKSNLWIKAHAFCHTSINPAVGPSNLLARSMFRFCFTPCGKVIYRRFDNVGLFDIEMGRREIFQIEEGSKTQKIFLADYIESLIPVMPAIRDALKTDFPAKKETEIDIAGGEASN